MIGYCKTQINILGMTIQKVWLCAQTIKNQLKTKCWMYSICRLNKANLYFHYYNYNNYMI